MKVEVIEQPIQDFVVESKTAVAHSKNLLSGLTVADDADYQHVCELLFDVAAKKKLAAERKDEVVGPAKQIISAVNGWFKPLESALADLESSAKALVREYNVVKESERIRLLKEATKLGRKDPVQARALQANAEAVLPPKVKGIAFVGKLDVEVVDRDKLPKKFFKLVVDEEAIQSAVDAEEITVENAAKFGVVVTDNRTVRVTAGQREAS